ncbi:MAG: dockerin type I domain-containing protein, partial [Rhodospirillales bacterium]|nr:dockerin type I domain-containing protein [Rhodospirillales bacterium]
FGFAGEAKANGPFFDGFEDLTLTPGNPSYTNVIPGWTRDNSGMADSSSNLAYDGGTAVNINEWVAEQGQGRNSQGVLSGNNALVFDGDGWQDFSSNPQLGFNSYWSRDVDLSGIDSSNLTVSFSYEFRAYDQQTGLAQVSFDAGATWTTLLELDSEVIGNTNYASGNPTYTAGTDFTPTSENMTIRFGKIDADNDWWFAVDNVRVAPPQVPVTLQVNPTSGDMRMNNTNVVDPFDIDFYEITSASGSLDSTGWNSLDEQDVDAVGANPGQSWDEAGGSDSELLSEAFLTGQSTLDPLETIGLGAGYDTSVDGQDLVFRYGLTDGTLVEGLVEYVQFLLPGDFNGDGAVDGQDFSLLKANFGVTGGATLADGDANGDGNVDGQDFSIL